MVPECSTARSRSKRTDMDKASGFCSAHQDRAPALTKKIKTKTYFHIPPGEIQDWIIYTEPDEPRVSVKGIFQSANLCVLV